MSDDSTDVASEWSCSSRVSGFQRRLNATTRDYKCSKHLTCFVESDVWMNHDTKVLFQTHAGFDHAKKEHERKPNANSLTLTQGRDDALLYFKAKTTEESNTPKNNFPILRNKRSSHKTLNTQIIHNRNHNIIEHTTYYNDNAYAN